MFRVGIVGCGGIAQVHAAVLDRLEETRLAACADIVPERAAEMAGRSGARAYGSLEEMLAAEKLDAVHLCTPHHLHAPMAETAAEAGVAVLTEKPPAISREQWETLEKAAEKVPVGVCLQNRYNPNVQEARRLIENGAYGSVLGARAFVTWQRDAAYYTDSPWRGAWATEGGSALINQSIHTLDLLVTLLGRPEAAAGSMSNRHLKNVIETEDTVEAYLTLGGRPALFYASNAYAANAPVLLDIQMERAVLRLEGEGMEIRLPDRTEYRAFPQPETLGKGYWGNGHFPCIRDFYRCLASGAPYPNRLEEVRDTVMLMLDLYGQGKKSLALS
ncbi:MAG: Gfo/Idh/MocA family oxidoreductase [Clostridia bacterium]|nr:Gfo/Idh/MocA family oxidoreductase [Clostridia bacterium]